MICFVESRFRNDAVSPKGARGLMQFMPATAARYGLKNPHDPKEAIDAAAHYLWDLLGRFGGRVDLAVAAYNAGEGAVESFRTGRPLLLRTGKVINARGTITGGVPPYPETQSYVKQILESLTFRSRAKSTSDSLTQKRDAIRQNDFTLDTDSIISDQSKNKRPASSSFIEIKDQL
jgi:soluble lytic murein transglycosylase-like protein